jgi:hypothetical protein
MIFNVFLRKIPKSQKYIIFAADKFSANLKRGNGEMVPPCGINAAVKCGIG